MVDLTVQIEAENSLTNDFIEFFQNLYEIFGEEFIKKRVLPLFEQLVNENESKGWLLKTCLIFV